jgi:zinc transport system substrate-binding protein
VRRRFLVIPVLLVMLVAACGDSIRPSGALETDHETEPNPPTDAARLTIGAAFTPIADVVRAVGGGRVHVLEVVPPGEEAHEYEPTPKLLDALSDADAIFYLGQGFQPNLEHALGSLGTRIATKDLLDGLELLDIASATTPDGGRDTDSDSASDSLASGKDPHVWLDPLNVAAMARSVEATLISIDPAGEVGYHAATDAYVAALEGLVAEMTAGLASCQSRLIVTSHEAFEYLAHRFGLRQLAIAGIEPDDEPSAKSLEKVADAARSEDVDVIFFESNLPASLANTVADEVGATTAVLDSIETLSDQQVAQGDDYFTVQRANLAALRTGLGCS